MKSITLVVAALALGLAACSDTPETPPVDTTASAPIGPAPNSVAYFTQVVGDRVFFDTDQHTLDSIAESTLRAQAQWMIANPGTSAVIEGHADERGTRAYNLALGARRADSAFRFLVSNGVPADRLRTVTFGKERPVALGSDPQSWAQNRRSVTVVAGAPTS